MVIWLARGMPAGVGLGGGFGRFAEQEILPGFFDLFEFVHFVDGGLHFEAREGQDSSGRWFSRGSWPASSRPKRSAVSGEA
jgi:hypothetical protein